MTKRCAKWCGSGCTEEAYQKATRDAEVLAKQLGDGWKPRVWENMGWHFEAVSSCGRLEVHGPDTRNGGRFYTAYLGEADEPGGRWAEHGKTAKAAVKATVREGKRELAEVTALLEGL